LTPTATAYNYQVIGHTEDTLLATIGDRLVEEPELISFPSEPTRREIAALSVIVARCGVPTERLSRAIDDIHHPDQSAGRKVFGPFFPELMIEDQPKPVIQIEVRLEALCGVNQKPTAMRASASAGFRAPCDWNTKGRPTAARERSPSSINPE
jgi:hypothetical protein